MSYPELYNLRKALKAMNDNTNPADWHQKERLIWLFDHADPEYFNAKVWLKNARADFLLAVHDPQPAEYYSRERFRLEVGQMQNEPGDLGRVCSSILREGY